MRINSHVPSDHYRSLLILIASYRVILDIFLVLLSFLPLFDSSSSLILGQPQNIISSVLSTTLRWDAIHFLSIAEHGYIYESQWAFLSGAPFLSQLWTLFKPILPSSAQVNQKMFYLFTGALLVRLIDGTFTLYSLTLRHFNSTSIAFLTALLSLLPSSPATLRHSPYAEPMFTYLSYKGMLHCAHNRWLYASITFALASLFRSNGVLLGGYIIWGLLIDPFLRRRMITYTRVLHCTSLVLLVLSPFVIHQYIAYLTFCKSPSASLSSTPAWCCKTIPSIYSHVQSTYWNVGFLKYWTLRQIPNFLISLPVLALILGSSINYIGLELLPELKGRFLAGQPYPASYPPHPPSPWVNSSATYDYSPSSSLPPSPSSAQNHNYNHFHAHAHNEDSIEQTYTIASSHTGFPSLPTNPASTVMTTPFFPPSVAPHAIHALILTTTVLFAAHTQIILRLAASMPFTYWCAAKLWVENPRLGRLWTIWSIVWGAISLVFWVVFLPPA